MGRFCTQHVKDRTDEELAEKVAELEKFFKTNDPRAERGRYQTLLRCRDEQRTRRSSNLSIDQLAELKGKADPDDLDSAFQVADEWRGIESR